jgi:hypothetical protein
MTDEIIPQVILLPQVQEEADKNPELAKALRGLGEAARNAMQGVSDGRYKSFEDAMEAMTGSRPEPVAPPNPPKHGYFLSVNPNPKGEGYMAVITDGHPQRGHTQIEILDMDIFKTRLEATKWFKRRCRELPWQEEKLEEE